MRLTFSYLTVQYQAFSIIAMKLLVNSGLEIDTTFELDIGLNSDLELSIRRRRF